MTIEDFEKALAIFKTHWPDALIAAEHDEIFITRSRLSEEPLSPESIAALEAMDWMADGDSDRIWSHFC